MITYRLVAKWVHNQMKIIPSHFIDKKLRQAIKKTPSHQQLLKPDPLAYTNYYMPMDRAREKVWNDLPWNSFEHTICLLLQTLWWLIFVRDILPWLIYSLGVTGIHPMAYMPKITHQTESSKLAQNGQMNGMLYEGINTFGFQLWKLLLDRGL